MQDAVPLLIHPQGWALGPGVYNHLHGSGELLRNGSIHCGELQALQELRNACSHFW